MAARPWDVNNTSFSSNFLKFSLNQPNTTYAEGGTRCKMVDVEELEEWQRCFLLLSFVSSIMSATHWRKKEEPPLDVMMLTFELWEFPGVTLVKCSV